MDVMLIEKKIKILLTGGGTCGSVSPLLAVANQLTINNYQLSINKKKHSSNKLFHVPCSMFYDFLWLGTKNGPEKQMVEKENIKFKTIASGKLRRYFSLQNFIDPLKIIIGFFQSLSIIIKYKPNLAMSAGSFVSVPVAWACWILRIPILIHQQDVRPGLSNKLIAIFAKVITVTFEQSLKDYGKKAIWTGNPVRKQLSIVDCRLSIKDIKKKLNLYENLPVVLIIGGGTGAMEINKLIWENLDRLRKFCQIIHITGEGKAITNYELRITNYVKCEFLNVERMVEAYFLADIVVSRCGMSVLTELAYLGKPAILIPIPNSHQEENAKIFQEKNAAIVLNQKKLNSEKFISTILRFLNNKKLQNKFRSNIGKVMKKGANKKIVEIVERIIHNNYLTIN